MLTFGTHWLKVSPAIRDARAIIFQFIWVMCLKKNFYSAQSCIHDMRVPTTNTVTHLCLILILTVASHLLMDNHSLSIISVYGQSLLKCCQCLSTIILVVSSVLIDNHSCTPTRVDQHSLLALQHFVFCKHSSDDPWAQ